MKKQCENKNCQKTFEVSDYDAKRGRGKYCSNQCRELSKKNQSGKEQSETMPERKQSETVVSEIVSEKKFQIALNGQKVCYPVCKGANLVNYVCKICGQDMSKYLRGKGKQTRVEMEEEFNSKYRNRPCPPSERLYTPEETAAKYAKLKELMKVWNSEPRR